ncbi:hypothetical protein [Granulicella aggregans]|uniref:hypothetical protein n=1 Tax=Granulicella aggregans TaxID=474949 RepID=UPI0021DF4F0C|nr:hypothetical protein [Granulicella aggregans]
MLARAERRHQQAWKLVEKWRLRIAELDRAGVAVRQARLWAEEQVDSTSKADTLGGALPGGGEDVSP